eukprot:10704639-Alexandrium_andersonii.AAC.1
MNSNCAAVAPALEHHRAFLNPISSEVSFASPVTGEARRPAGPAAWDRAQNHNQVRRQIRNLRKGPRRMHPSGASGANSEA